MVRSSNPTAQAHNNPAKATAQVHTKSVCLHQFLQQRVSDMPRAFCLCSSGPQQLDNGCSAFERGSVDVCEFTAPAVRRIESVAMATDTSCAGVHCGLTFGKRQ